MSDLALRTATRTQLALYSATAMIAAYAGRATERLHREESGQDLIEYAGIVVLIAAIITAIGVSGLGASIGNTIKNDVTNILAGH
jgi:Flp pilus assembly pilin Flp